MKNVVKLFGKIIKRKREAWGFTTVAVAQGISCSHATIINIENGASPPRMEIFLKLIIFFDLSEAELREFIVSVKSEKPLEMQLQIAIAKRDFDEAKRIQELIDKGKTSEK